MMNFEKPEKQNFEKMKKKKKKNAGDAINLHMCTKNHNHMKYSSWDTKLDWIFLPFWTTFEPSTPTKNPESQNFEKMKKASGDVIIFNLCNKKNVHIMYDYSDMKCGRHFCHFRLFLLSFTPLLTPKIKNWKNVKKHLEILSFYTCVP